MAVISTAMKMPPVEAADFAYFTHSWSTYM